MVLIEKNMKYQFIFLLLVILTYSGYLPAQEQGSFELLISKPEDQVIFQVTEGDEGSFVLVGRLHNIDTYYPGGYIIKIDSLGNLIQEKVIQYSDTNFQIFFNVHFFNNYYYLLGSRNFFYPDTTKLWYLKLNTNLDVISEKYLNIPNNRWLSYMNSIIDTDTNFVLTGYTTRPDTTTPSPYNNDPFFYKISLSGDSLTSKFMSTNYILSLSFNIIEKFDQTGYFAYGSKYSSPSSFGGQRFSLDKQLDSLGILGVPYNITTYTSSTKLNDSLILISGGGGSMPSAPPYSLNVLSTTQDNVPINYNYFKIEGNMRDFPAIYNGVSKNADNIYVGGNSNFDYYNPFYSNKDSWFHLIKINPDITPIWEYWYGGDAYYHLYSMIATNDGGCLMVGNRYDDEIQNQERDIYIAKVNSEGLIVWTQEIPIKKQETTVYPNPGTNQINIKTDNKELDFELININGQVLFSQIVNNNLKTINTESLKSGMYFFRLIDKKYKTIETGKWIKK